MLEVAGEKPSRKKKTKTHRVVDEVIQNERKAVEKQRAVEELKDQQDKLRYHGKSMEAESLNPKIRINSVEGQNHRETAQKLRNRLQEKIEVHKSEGRDDKAAALHDQLAGDYKKLYTWSQRSHERTKSPVHRRAAEEFYHKHLEHQRSAIKP